MPGEVNSTPSMTYSSDPAENPAFFVVKLMMPPVPVEEFTSINGFEEKVSRLASVIPSKLTDTD